MEIRHQVRVNSAQVDELGHLNHSYAVQILEYARDEWYAAAGLWEGRRWSGEENLQTIVLNINVNYRQECFLDEPLTVVIAGLDGGTKSFRLSQEVLKQDGSIAIDAVVTSSVMRMDAHETVEVPHSIRSCLPPRQTAV